jgi:tyrosyl-tRNA synthetase
MTDNAEWLDPLNYIDFLRDVGRHFSVNRMLSFDSVKLRLEREQRAVLPRVQLHDPAGLRLRRAVRRYGCGCRWAARTSGATSSTASSSAAGSEAPQLFALTCPLITTSSGAKMGKTAPARCGSTPTC